MMKLYLENQNYKTAIGKKATTCHWVYSHGELEKMVLPMYDIVNHHIDDMFDEKTDRIEDVIAVLPNEKEVPARLFYWIRKNTRIPAGLVVSLNDKRNLAYAQEMFDMRADII